MKWFKNLRTVAKLMIGFGFLAALMGVVGYQGVSRMGAINDMLGTLYQRDMLGVSSIKEVNTLVAMIGRQTRGVVIDTEMAAMERGKQKVDTLFEELQDTMTKTEKYFVTEAGKALIGKLKEIVPEYKSICNETIRVAMTNDKKAAAAVLARAAALGDRVAQTSKAASEMKEKFGQQAFENGTRTYEQSRTLMLSIMCIAVVLALALGMFVARLIANPLGQTVGVLQAVADRDLTQSVDLDTKDEVGQMGKALNVAVDGIRDALREVRGAADNLATASQQLASSSEELSSGAQEQASSLEETSASLEEITSSVKQNADSAKQANQLAAAARETAEKGGTVVKNAVAAMGEINTSSKRIADIITAIDEIAFQTNLLALNAAVEAARAGEQGRGFAVVASEVRSLAQRSATAAKEIKTLIQDSVRKVEAGSQMVNQSGEVLVEIVASVKRVTDIVGEIAAASREQSTGIEQVSKAMAQMDQVTQQNAAQTEELSSTAQALSTGAEQLQGLVARFRVDNERSAARSYRREPAAARTAAKPIPAKRTRRDLHAMSLNLGTSNGAAEETAPAPAQPGGGFDEF